MRRDVPKRVLASNELEQRLILTKKKSSVHNLDDERRGLSRKKLHGQGQDSPYCVNSCCCRADGDAASFLSLQEEHNEEIRCAAMVERRPPILEISTVVC
jgi:hypothetical protein